MALQSSQEWDAAKYDTAHNYVWQLGASLVELLAPKSNESILDIGCGTGHLTAQIADYGARVVGIDAAAAMIEAAKGAYPALDFRQCDALQLAQPQPFATASFDAIFSNAAIHWINQPETLVIGMARVLRPGGRLVAEFGGAGNVRLLRRAIAAALITVGAPADLHALYFPRLSEYTALLERHGFEVASAQLFDRPTPLDGEDGLFNWAAQFESRAVARLTPTQRSAFGDALAAEARQLRSAADAWFADYRRLRITAVNAPESR